MSVTRKRTIDGWRWSIYRFDMTLENPSPKFSAYAEKKCTTDSGKVYFRKMAKKDFAIGDRASMLEFVRSSPADFAATAPPY